MKFPWNTSNGNQVIEQTRNSITKDQREITPKYLKQSYGSCAWHIVLLYSRNVWSFNQIALTVFNLQSGQKIAISYVTREIIWRINMQELWFLCMTRCLNVLYKYMKFRWNISNGYQVIEGTRNSIANDQRDITPKHPKQSYRSCTWRIVPLCSRSVWSFDQIVLTVFNLQSGQKALIFVTRGIIW